MSPQFYKSQPDIEAWLQENKVKDYVIYCTGSVDVNGSVNIQTPCDFLPVRFRFVMGDFVAKNLGLQSLAGSPIKTGGHFNVADNQLTSLIGCPKNVGGELDVSNNQLTNLQHSPSHIRDFYYAQNNPIATLEGVHSFYWGDYAPEIPVLRISTQYFPILSYFSAQEMTEYLSTDYVNLSMDYIALILEKTSIVEEKLRLESGILSATPHIIEQNRSATHKKIAKI